MHWFYVQHTLGSLNGISIHQEKGFISLDINSRHFGPDRSSLFGGRGKEELKVARFLTIRSAVLTLIDHAGPEDPHNNHDWRYLKMPVGALDQPII